MEINEMKEPWKAPLIMSTIEFGNGPYRGSTAISALECTE